MNINFLRNLTSTASFSILFFFFLLPFGIAKGSDEYSFDLDEFEKKSFEWGGYAEVKYERIDINNNVIRWHYE